MNTRRGSQVVYRDGSGAARRMGRPFRRSLLAPMALSLLLGLLALGCDPGGTPDSSSPETSQSVSGLVPTPAAQSTQAPTLSTLPGEDCFEDWESLNGGQRDKGVWDRSCASTSRTGSFAHYYRFNLPQQIGVQIDLEASANSYLYLLRGAEVGGEVIASNDDAASGTSNSQIFVLLEAGEYTIEATTQERGTTGEFRVTLVPVREHVSFAPAQCPPEPVPAPGAQAIDTLSLNNTDGPELANSYLSACLEGAWRQMETLGSRGLLHPVGIAVIDSGLYEPPDTDSYRNLVVQNEFDWERISVRDTVQDRVFETEDDRFRRSHHGTAVASILAAVNQGGHSGLAKSGGGYDPSFSGVVGSVPSLDYELHFYEAQKSGEKKELDFGAIERAMEDIEALGDRIDVVNLSQGLVCDNNDNPAAFLLCRYRVFGAPTNRNDRYKGLIERMPEVIFVAGAGNSGADALFSTPARLSLELPNVITVGAVETNDGTGEANRWVDDQTKASNYGTPITIAAQGAQLYALTTTSPVEAYRRDSGTSFAAPLVSGVAAFLRAIDPDIAAREVVEILGESSTPIPVCTVNDPDIAMENCPEEQREHWRLLNADAAVKELLKRRGIASFGSSTAVSTAPTPEPVETTLKPSPGNASTDRAALIALYNATDGPNWVQKSRWRINDMPMDEWPGVGTDTTGRVISLTVQGFGLTGNLPAELGNLAALRRLHLRGNRLSGNIPAELGNLSNLRYLWLADNQLSGEIPRELGSLTNLENLRLSHNQLSGGIPATLGKLTNLTALRLFHNQLSGEIPAALGKLTNLQLLQLDENQLTGAIPEELGNLYRLSTLTLNENHFSGTVPRVLGDLISLHGLRLGSNEWSGCIPPALDAKLDSDVFSLGLPFCEEAASPISSAVAADREALIALYQANNGAAWKHNRNWLTSQPLNRWAGVSTDHEGRVVGLRVAQIDSQIPAEIGDLTKLRVLYVSGDFNRPVPTELGLLTELEVLTFSGKLSRIPPEMGMLRNLKVLLLAGVWHGEIPAALGQLAELEELYIFEGNLGGEIPPEIGNLTNLRVLYLPNNQLTGQIPKELGNLVKLRSLRLDGNDLGGEVPAELGLLSNLRELQLSGNDLGGCLPSTFEWQDIHVFRQVGLPLCVS